MRCLSLASKLMSPPAAFTVRTAVFVSDEPDPLDFSGVTALFPDVRLIPEPGERKYEDEAPDLERAFDGQAVVVIDNRSTDDRFREKLPGGAVTIALDDSGEQRESAECVIDILTPGRRRSKSNVMALPILPSRSRDGEKIDRIDKAVVTFGGEDPADLTGVAVRALRRFLDPQSIDVVIGPAFRDRDRSYDAVVLGPLPDLKERFADYDLVVTSFGLTAFEAAAAGAAVAIVDPTPYHARLSRRFHFRRLGIRRVAVRRLRRVFSNPACAQLKFRNGNRASLVAFLADNEFPYQNLCPVCGKRGVARARFRAASFFVCRCTDIVYRVAFSRVETGYNRRYFFEEYKKQYGKTYLEDFESIRQTAVKRLSIIRRGFACGGSLLDVGCAYGPFLAEAAGRGYHVYGIDVADDAINYVKNELKLRAAAIGVLEFDPFRIFGVRQFDVVTLWYVIEHFEKIKTLLEKLAVLVAAGGILAFSTPNLTGVSGRFREYGFFESSPPDHFTVLSPAIVRRMLPRFGFEPIRIRSTGHHPERFPFFGRFRLLHPLLAASSRILRLGDTFEVYARRRAG